MKKIAKMLLSLVVVMSLATGCVKYNVDMEVKDDKSVNLDIIYAMDLSAFGDLASDSDDSNYDSSSVKKSDYDYLEKAGYKVDVYDEKEDDKEYKGVKISKTFKNIDEITADSKTIVNFNDVFDSDKKKDPSDVKFFYKNGTNYAANFVFDLSEDEEESTSSFMDTSAFDMKYTITLPKESVFNNADHVSEDGKTLTWDLKYGQENEVNFEFPGFGGLGKSVILAVSAVLGIAIVVAVVIAIVNKNNQKPNNNTEGMTKINLDNIQ